jgi:hypothetical protein
LFIVNYRRAAIRALDFDDELIVAGGEDKMIWVRPHK